MKHATSYIVDAFRFAVPVMLGYVVIGLPCGLMESSLGFTPLMCFVVSATFYSGAGQFMYSNMWLGGSPLYAIIASVSFVNTRQILYSAAFSPFFANAGKLISFFFSATVTDESFGVNMERFTQDESWTARHALAVNLLCMSSWALSNAAGCVLGAIVDLPLAITSFAMTSIFICLLVGQDRTGQSVTVMLTAALAVVVLKLVGLSGPAILLGAVCGVVVGVVGEKDGAAHEHA